MKYVILKSSTLLCFQFSERNGDPLQILCFDRKEDFNDFMKANEGADNALPATTLIDADASAAGDNLSTGSEYFSKVVDDGFFIHQKSRFRKVLFADILWVEASRSYSYLHLKDQSTLIVSYSMAGVKQKLPFGTFMQTHRSYLVNLTYVEGFIGNMLCIGKTKLPISKSHRKEVFSKFIILDPAKGSLAETEGGAEETGRETEKKEYF